MARVSGIDLPNNKRIETALTYLYGIGDTTAKKILAEAKVDSNKRAKDLTDAELASIQSTLAAMEIPVEGELRRIVSSNIRRLQEIGSYRGNLS